MMAIMETLEIRTKERLEGLHKLLDSIYDDQAGKDREPDNNPSEREKRERAILLTMLGL